MSIPAFSHVLTSHRKRSPATSAGMSPSSHAPSTRPGSARSSLLRRMIPKGFQLTPILTDTNSTTTGLSGPGRTLGSMLSSAGRRLERIVDRVSEQQLGLGPNVAALRVTSALHNLHTQTSHGYGSPSRDHDIEGDTSAHVTDRLIWVCNGYCSFCHGAYLPYPLDDLSGTPLAERMSQLIKYLQSNQPTANIAMAAIYVRILIQSGVLSETIVRNLDILGTLKSTLHILEPPQISSDPASDELVALKLTIAAVEQMIKHRSARDSLQIRFPEISQSVNDLNTLDQFVSDIRTTDEWLMKQILYTRLLTSIAILVTSYITAQTCEITKRGIDQLSAIVAPTPPFDNIPSYLLAYGTDTMMLLTGLSSSKTALPLAGHQDRVSLLSFSPAGSQVVSSSWDKTVRIWDTHSGREMAKFKHPNTASSVAFSRDGTQIASGDVNGAVRLWDIRAQEQLSALYGANGAVSSVIFSKNTLLIASIFNNEIQFCNTATRPESRIAKGHAASVTSVDISHDGSTLASGSDDKSTRLWDAELGYQITEFGGFNAGIRSVRFSSDGQSIASVSQRTIHLLDVRSGRPTGLLNGRTPWPWVTSATFSRQGTHLVSGFSNHAVSLWDVRMMRQIAILRGHTSPVESVGFSPDDLRVVSGSHDGSIIIWGLSIPYVQHGEDVLIHTI